MYKDRRLYFFNPPFFVYTWHASSFFYKRFQEKKKDFSINASFCWGVMLYIFGDFTWKIQACLSGKIQVKGRQRKYVRGYVYLSVWKCLCAWRCVISYNLECLLAHVVYICVKYIYISNGWVFRRCASVSTRMCLRYSR